MTRRLGPVRKPSRPQLDYAAIEAGYGRPASEIANAHGCAVKTVYRIWEAARDEGRLGRAAARGAGA